MKEFFFNVISVKECQAILESFPQLNTENRGFDAIVGRYLGEDLVATENLPIADRASMDGYAVKASDVFGASESNPAYLEQSASIEIGQLQDFSLKSGDCASIVTGGFLPAEADAVVMVEHTQKLGSGTIEIRRSLAPHDNIMLKGEDASEGQVILKKGCFIRAQELGFMAALGLTNPKVYSMPKVGVISTGDELVEAGQKIQAGQIRDVNSPALMALINGIGASASYLGIIPDKLADLSLAVKKGLAENDVVILSGGSSVGIRDYTVEVLSQIPNSTIVVQGVAMSPGKPLIVAKIAGEQGIKTVIGLPGQITSAQVVMHILIVPFLRHLAGASNAFDSINRLCRPALLSRNIASRQGREDYVRVRLEYPEQNMEQGKSSLPIAHPIQGKSGLVRTLVEAQGLLKIPYEVEGFEAQSQHEIILL